MAFFYAAASYLVFFLCLPFLLTHPKLRDGFCQRLGYFRRGSNDATQTRQPQIWVHGASAGDILALLPTVRELKEQTPALEVVASTITNSGHAMAKRNPDLFARVFYLPWDVPAAVRSTMRKVRPAVLVLEYTELWPNLIHAARARGVHVVLHNGRLAAPRLQQYRWLFAIAGNLLAPLSLLLMRDASEAERALLLGAPPERIHITGNTKFDGIGRRPEEHTVCELATAAAFAPADPVWVAGSTHEGEEEIVLDILRSLRKTEPNLRLIIAPRYLERCDRIVHLVHKRNFRARLRSQPGPAPDVLVLDTLGELPACYSLATLVFVGGSFVPRGGQNILEPAACGKPVLFGPYMHNFADSVQVLLGRGGIQVVSAEQLERVMLDLLGRRTHLQELGETARAQVSTVRGAARRNAHLIKRLLDQRQRTMSS